MGSSASKAAGRAAAASSQPSAAAQRASRYDLRPSDFVSKRVADPPLSADSVSDRRDQAESQRQEQHQAAAPASFSETKNERIEEDGADAHLNANLRILGQVRVSRPVSQYQPADQMVSIMHKRSQDKEEEEELDPIHLARRRNVLTAPLLADLLDARKSVSNPNELRNVADKYNMEVELVERLGQVVNSPSVLKQTPLDVKRDVVHSVWVDPPSTNQ